MYAQGLIPQPIVSFHLLSTDVAGFGGEILFGGSDPTYYNGNLMYAPVSSDYFWQFSAVNITIPALNITLCNNDCETLVDSGTSLILGPLSAVQNIFKAINATGPDSDTQYYVDCSTVHTLPLIAVAINGYVIEIPPSVYINKFIDSKTMKVQCVVGIQDNGIDQSVQPQWTLGAIFMLEYYTEFDLGNRQIGFAVNKKIESKK